MENQGEYRLDVRTEEMPEPVCLTREPEKLCGSLRLSADEAAVCYSNIRLLDEEGKKRRYLKTQRSAEERKSSSRGPRLRIIA